MIIVQLHQSGKSRAAIAREYDLTPSSLDKWIKQATTSGSFKEKDNRSEQEEELQRLRKELAHAKMENDIFKASRADHGTKVNVIRNNAHKYSVSAMCAVLNLSRSTYYYAIKHTQRKPKEDALTSLVRRLFLENRGTYGTRKLKALLLREGYHVSRRRIGRIMASQGLVSVYTVAKYKPKRTPSNEAVIANKLNRSFAQEEERHSIVSDLTYTRVNRRWHYVCLLLDLYNREVIGWSHGPNKTSELVKKAFASVTGDLRKITLFHTDRGSEFTSRAIDESLLAFGIERSLSLKGCPYDNAVAESMFHIVKVEFLKRYTFDTTTDLERELADYLHWYNHFRIHGTLQYQSPIEFKQTAHKKSV
ncbi:IS3 family transposase [Shouchella patagoniensis]|uniref:IS3 family transposase n=1 Tax=Shouchella patagoniensis TaxID=228576 RepID=UPI001115C130|nr:IS3 family transposase [Shouchella patagoniensis]